MSFVHLHNHSEYSLLNGAIRTKALVKRAKEFGMPAVALTDYGNMFGAVEFYLEAKNQGIKPIIGAVLFHPSHDKHKERIHRRGVDHLFQILVLVQNETGYRNLCAILSESYLEGFYYKPRVNSNLLKEHSEGLLALSAGWNSALNHYLIDGQKEKALEYAKLYSSIFEGRYYIELQDNDVDGQKETNDKLVELAHEVKIPLVVTNNCHYLDEDDAEAFETLQCIQTGATLHGAHDHLKFSTSGYYFKNQEEIQKDFSHLPEAIEESLKIADLCNFDFDLKTYHFPKYEAPKGMSLDDFLIQESYDGLEKRWPEILKSRKLESSSEGLDELKTKYKKRLEFELNTIQSMGFSGYFLIVADFIQYAKDHQIPVGPGRGSAAGSLVAYCIRITDLDPLPYNLLFERFLNPERISMPDVDIDFCMNGRDQVLTYVNEKYGNVSQIITYGKMKAKAVIRDVGRVMEMPYADVDKIAKLIPNALNITLEQAFEQEPRLKELCKEDAQVDRLMAVARKLEGLNRHASTHAAGVVISDKPLSQFLPLYKGGNGDIVTQYDMKYVEKIGLIKFDFLGLKTLTVIDNALKIVKRTHNKDINILQIPLDDPKVYEMVSRGDANGVFQLESSGMKDLMSRMKPGCFEDLVALVALYRPGPLGSGMVDDFINRKKGKTAIVYDLPQLEPILKDTYGVIVYQEQVMQIASALGGYSLGEADLLRRAMGKKKVEEMAAQRVRFLEGCKKKKIPQDKAEKIFDLMAKFAEYGFNKSHSAAYALVSYQTAYLKAHYPVEYLASILTTEMHNTDRVQFYIQDCLAHNIEVLPPDVNESFYGFSVVGENQIRYGLGAIKNVGESAIESIVAKRKENGPYTSFFHFCDQTDYHKVNKRVFESLIKCGGFDSLDKRRRALFTIYEKAIELSTKKQKSEAIGQSQLFSLMESGTTAPVGVTIPQMEEWTENERLSYEKEALGFYLTGHPLNCYASELRKVASASIKSAQSLANESEVVLAGMINQSKIITTKKGSRMAFCTFEDLTGSSEVIVFSKLFQEKSDLLSSDKPLILKAKTDRGEEGTKLIALDISLLQDYMGERTKSIHFRLKAEILSEKSLSSLQIICSEYPGTCDAYIHLHGKEKSETILKLSRGLSLDKADILKARVNMLFKQDVVDYTL